MAIHQQMYAELVELRQNIKGAGRQAGGRAPFVCSDDALLQIAQLRPKKITDLEGIPGIGRAFIDNYGEAFLAVVRKYGEAPGEKAVHMTRCAQQTLKELEKKLVSINRRNRLLYMPRLSPKYGFDLFPNGAEMRELLFGSRKPVTLCDSSRGGTEAIRHRRLVQLLREVNKDLRDKGQNDLYIGYPFVTGKLAGEDFDVRAPLALFPVAAERLGGIIRLSIDESRDIVYNSTLVLAHFKFNHISRPLPSEPAESGAEHWFLDCLLDFYREQEMPLRDQGRESVPFTEYKAGEFPRFRSGELVMEPCAVLGKFPLRDSAIQRDFGELLKTDQINSLLNGLLLNPEELDIYADCDNNRIQAEDLPVSENGILYINDLNSAQEMVLCAMETQDTLVVQGPPGTGKSQTITSLIAQFAARGKTVLMVSEKKTALDVVYSRLGDLSRYALLIDDVGNKDAFYRQLGKMTALGKAPGGQMPDLSGVAGDIDTMISRLETIARKLYTPGALGVEPYRLYNRSHRIDLSDPNQRAQTMAVYQSRDSSLLRLTYETLDALYERFRDPAFAGQIDRFYGLSVAAPWLRNIRGDLTDYQLLELESRLKTLSGEIRTWQGKNFLVKPFTKGRLTKTVGEILSTYFTVSNKNLSELLLNNCEKVLESLPTYLTYQQLSPVYQGLQAGEQQWLRSLQQLRSTLGRSLTEANDILYNEILFEHISRFEAENRTLLQDIGNFDAIVRSISRSMDGKQKLTRHALEKILAEGMYGLTGSKRHGEILRILESRRKWSVSKFIRKFDFELFRSVKIWLLTPEVVSEILPLQTGIFDLVVFDEASQMYVEKGIPAIFRAKKVVIAGDHKQLRPSNLGSGRLDVDVEELPEDSELGAALEEESLLDLARFKYRDVLLNFHYRSRYEELIAFSNYAFYGGRLLVSPNAAPPEEPPIRVHRLEDALWKDRCNLAEAKYIIELLKQFFAHRREQETVGIITFNIGQRDLIEDLLDEACAADPEFAAVVREETARKQDGEDIGLFIKNIESVQGDERDVIIFSVGYAKNEQGRLVRNFGWLNQRGGENRLNVAISRAKKKIHIVTSFRPEELPVEDMKNDGPRILKKYLIYAAAVSDGDRDAARAILLSFGGEETLPRTVTFDSPFEEQVYDALTKKGYEVDTQVGIGGYRIDLAVKREGKYILGIECDGKLYHSSKSARERDLHRQKYLESRGWRIHRIWSTNWWRAPQEEIGKIIAILESMAPPPSPAETAPAQAQAQILC